MSSRAEEKARRRDARLAEERDAARTGTQRRRLVLLGGVLAAAAVIVLVAVLVSRSGSEEPTASEAVAAFSGVPQDGIRLGRPDAPVVVEEYADLQCPFCAQFATDQLPALVRERVRSGEVRLDLRLLTFLGEDSVEAGRMAAATGLQDRQWQFTEAFYAEQGAEGSGYVTEDFLRDVAGRVPGLDVDRALADRDDARVERQLAQAAAAAERARVRSTPSFLVSVRGGEPVQVGADGLDAAIEDALAAAR